jgi:hypothetical protein
MVKTVIRHAEPKDWQAILQHQQTHVESLDFDVSFPTLHEATWLVADVGDKQNVASLGYIDRPRHQPEERQIILLWNKGRYQTVGAKHLMNKMLETAPKTVWFVTHNNCSKGALAAFAKWGFNLKASSDNLTLYVRNN